MIGEKRSIPAALLGIIFFGHSIIILFLEPATGFRAIEDYFDRQKVVPALESVAWFTGNSLHVAAGATLLLFQEELRGVAEKSSTVAGKRHPADIRTPVEGGL